MEKCLDLFKLCSLDDKRSLLKLMKEDVQQYQDTAPSEDNGSVDSDKFFFSKFISVHNSFVDDNSFLDDLRIELDSMDLFRPNSRKVKSFWLNPSGDSDGIDSISKYPNIGKLLNMVNARVSDVKDGLNCCNIICYSNVKKSLRLHSDIEPNISQTHPIATFSLGATRRVEFVPIGSHHTRVVHSVDAIDNSLYVMHSGCQAVLKQRVLQGDSAGSDDHIRYSISFRKSNYPAEIVSNIHEPPCEESPNLVPATRIPVSILAGDSFLARLDKERLEKNKKKVINLAKGGNTIQNVIQNLHSFRNNSENEKFLVNKMFISVGTNDIRYCRNGISHLKGELFRLVRVIKNLFPSTKIYIQSLIPLPITHDNSRLIVRNVLEFNKIIFHVCFHERAFMIDVFKSFLYRGHRNPFLFPNSVNDIHPNRRGLGVLARRYIDIIHSRHFDPLSHS